MDFNSALRSLIALISGTKVTSRKKIFHLYDRVRLMSQAIRDNDPMISVLGHSILYFSDFEPFTRKRRIDRLHAREEHMHPLSGYPYQRRESMASHVYAYIHGYVHGA